MPKFEDIAGQKFGNGKVLAVKRVADHIKPNGRPVTRYLCLCDCGGTFIAARHNLVDGHTKSCGCLSKQKKSGRGMKYCAYLPMAVDCTTLNCQKCGWNPYNKALREKRIAKIKERAGIA